MSTTVEKIEKTKAKKGKKDNLLLDSLEIKGYRCFEHLTIEKLGRVNLIVGKNNVGKTALLEALWIYANHDDIDIIHKIVFNRDEITTEKTMSHDSLKEYNFALRNLFTNRPTIPNRDHDRKDSLSFIIAEAGRDLDFIKHEALNDEIDKGQHKRRKFNEAEFNLAASKTTFLRYFYSSAFGMPQAIYLPTVERNIENVFINSFGLRSEKLIEFWDAVTLTPLEDEVIKALNLVLPQKIIRIDFIGNPSGSNNRVPIVRVINEKDRIPLKSFGEGLTRLLGLSLAMVQCRNGIIFIDEIENGLHYSILLDVWRFIFKTARSMNIQVFAATHSSDCVKAFQRAAEEDKEDEGILIRLVRKNDKIKAILFDEEELETVVENDIEVR